jgi:glutaredoxin-like YruB-family protein
MEKKVIVYSTLTCPYCNMVKNFLAENNIDFDTVDVGNDPQAAQEMIDKSGQMGVPVVEIGGKIIVGFNKETISKELGI